MCVALCFLEEGQDKHEERDEITHGEINRYRGEVVSSAVTLPTMSVALSFHDQRQHI